MEFAIALVSFWDSYGFNTLKWRRSVDETQPTEAVVHLEYAAVLVADIRTNPNVQIYQHPSTEFDALMQSPKWYKEVVQ